MSRNGQSFTRSLRKAITFRALDAGMRLSQRAKSPRLVEAVSRGLSRTFRLAFPLKLRTAHNMKLAGVYYPGLVDDYFDRCVDQLRMVAHAIRAGLREGGVTARFTFDDSFAIVEQAYAAGNGVIHIAPHLCGYPLYASVVSSRIPCTVYMRRNTDPRKQSINERVAASGEGDFVFPPEGATKPERLQVAIDVLREGRMLFVTPDTPRKADQGVSVRIFGFETFFPTGVYIMAARTGAAVVPVFWHWANGRYHIRYREPLEIKRGRNIRAQTEAATIQWAASVDAFIREHPAMWWNWLDKRWTQIIRSGEGQTQHAA